MVLWRSWLARRAYTVYGILVSREGHGFDPRQDHYYYSDECYLLRISQ